MNPKYNFAKMPFVEASSLYAQFPKSIPKEAVDLLISLFEYDPT